MKKRILFILSVFFFWVFVFLIQKTVFSLLNGSVVGGVALGDLFRILYNGLSLDFSTSGYLTALPLLLTIVTLWVKPFVVQKILFVYFLLTSILISSIFVLDLMIYPYWDVHIDASIFLFMSSPKDAMASAAIMEVVFGFTGLIVVCGLTFVGFKKLVLDQMDSWEKLELKQTWKSAVVMLLMGGLLFLAIRGGVTVSTMNVGRAYFSGKMFLNHAAINPHFNLLYSLTKSEKFEKQYQFYDREKVDRVFSELMRQSSSTTEKVLNTNRPNVILILLESFSAEAAYDSVVAPNLVRLSKEGVNFSNFYANSFRTDRGLVSILSGYPAHPTVALMKYPAKTQLLPSIPNSLVGNGYSSAFYYGGDADFASMRSYIIGTCAVDAIYDDKTFPLSTRLSKWGTPDGFVFQKVFDDINSGVYKEPFMITMLTLSSHEPFDVPMDTVLDDPFLNAMHYTDRCIGEFMDNLKSSELWDNTLVVFVADHCMQSYPKGVEGYDSSRYHIPMIWAGGAVDTIREVSSYGAQNDLAATLLAQLDIDYRESRFNRTPFVFSKDLLNPVQSKFAFYSYNNGFCMVDSTGTFLYDNNSQEVLIQEGTDLGEKAKAFFQTMYLDLGER